MSKGSKDMKKSKDRDIDQAVHEKIKNKDYLVSMSAAPSLDESTHWFQMLPAAFFTAVIIIITRMHTYTRPMDQFFWSNNGNNLNDFFSYYKMIFIFICAILALILLLYRVFTVSFFVKRSFAYIPMLIYSVFVLLSYALSDYKLFALWGWNDRFEGTLTILSYMVMLFFIINSVNSERNVKWIIFPVGAFSALLGILGLSQALDHDFFRTTIGKKLITPSWFWDQLDKLNFTFQEKQIYQTVYNIDYVSFYLTLLVPIFGLLFIRSFSKGKDEPLWKKMLWAALFTLLMFNLIGSVSSGGYLGLFIVIVMGIIILNKRILAWKVPVLILFVLAILMCFANISQLQSEFKAAKNFFGSNTAAAVPGSPNPTQDVPKQPSHIDYIDTNGNDIKISIAGNEMILTTFPDDPSSIKIKDSKGKNIPLELVSKEDGYLHKFNDERFSMCSLRPAVDANSNHYYIFYIDDSEWAFQLTPNGPLYINKLGKLVDLDAIKHIGFNNNPGFGSGRGLIWSGSFPMLKDTVLIGHGADTYCLYYPQKDYVGKYNAGWNINTIIDKPHNMYLGTAINTGIISLLALVAFWLMYIIQSIKLYYGKDFDTDFVTFAGSGIFLGVCGFLAAALVNDSSVSVMPLFYGLLGTGIAINMMLSRSKKTI
jgi:hypothetical protein